MPPLDDFEEEAYKGKLTSRVFQRIAGLLKPHMRWVIVFILAILLVSFFDSVFTFISKHIIDDGIMKANITALTRWVALYGSLIVAQAISVFVVILLAGVLGERIRYDLRKRMFEHLQNLSLSYYSRTAIGWIIARVTSDTERVSDLVTWGLVDSSWAVMSILTSMFFMLIINWRLALIVLAILPILLIIAIEFRKRILSQYRNVRRMNSKIVGSFNENITGVRVIKALGRESQNLEEFSDLTHQMYRSSFKAAWLSALFLPVVQMIAALALGAILWYGGYQAQTGSTMTIGSIQAFVSYVTFMMWPVQDLARVFAEMQHSFASAERIFTLLDTTPEVTDRPEAKRLKNLRGNIVFNNVSFAYSDARDVPVIRNLSLTVKQGETIALVGPTGGGKTTIVNLMCRFYEPSEGTIQIAGHDYRTFNLESIQKRIGVVLQTPHLFSGTVKENLRYGKLDATDAQIHTAAKLAGAHDFIKKLKKGYQEEVGEGGNLLSVGQKQLISLARAILADPEIFIMDEATSSVDTITEALIQKGMEHLMKGRTSFIIAHRLSTIKRADRILVIDEGRIIESGTHTELMRAGGKYSQLYSRQFRFQMEGAIESLQQNETVEA